MFFISSYSESVKINNSLKKKFVHSRKGSKIFNENWKSWNLTKGQNDTIWLRIFVISLKGHGLLCQDKDLQPSLNGVLFMNTVN